MITYHSTMTVETCCNCGMDFAMTDEFRQRMLDSGRRFYCPSGHQQHYSDTTVARLKRRVALLEREEEELRERVRAQKKETASAKGQATKAKNRAKRGVCLYCNRTVKQMAKHVADKHPEEVATA